jgi:hypothetical protein
MMAAIIGKAIPPQRKRVLDALHLREPDRVPIVLWGTIEGYQNLRKAVGMDYKADPRDYRTGSTTWTTDVSFEIELAEKLGVDSLRISMGRPADLRAFARSSSRKCRSTWAFQPPNAEINVDEWGVIRKWTPHEHGRLLRDDRYPLFHATSAPLEEGLKMLEAYPWPDPWDEGPMVRLAYSRA